MQQFVNLYITFHMKGPFMMKSHNISEKGDTNVQRSTGRQLNVFHFVGAVTLFIWAATSFCMASV